MTRLLPVFVLLMLLPGCATKRYVREQIAVARCDIIIRQLDREGARFDATFDEFERLNRRYETTIKMSDIARRAKEKADAEFYK